MGPALKKVALIVLIFVLVGELMTRFDKSFLIMEERRVVKIPKSIEKTPEYELIRKKSFTPDTADFRIMVIGDSYIYGGGIEFKDNFSQNLKRLINTNKGNFVNGWVLDISKSSSNNLDNNQAYFEYVDIYRPNVVIIGYNLNDVGGNLQKDIKNSAVSRPQEEDQMHGTETQSLIQKIYGILYTSEFIQFVLHNAHKQLKAHGIVIPGSEFDMQLKSYYQNRNNWRQSQILLKEVIEHASENKIELIIYKFPEMDLIEHPNLFTKSDLIINSFFNSCPSVHYIDGSEQFRNAKSKDYRLSKYDGHPNAYAHKKIAEKVFDLIRTTSPFYILEHK
jgi:hypothetical protein